MLGIFNELGELGVQDGTVRSDINISDTLLTMMNVFGNFSKKTAMIHGISGLQTFVEDSEQFTILKDIFIIEKEPSPFHKQAWFFGYVHQCLQEGVRTGVAG